MQPFPAALPEAALAAVVRCLAQDDKIAAAYFLGSGAEERLRADSDVDIALLPVQGKHFTAPQRLNLAADLTSLAGRPVDLGILHTGNLVYAKEAVAGGRLIFERDHSATTRFAALVFSMYADLQENRREVLHAYAA